MKQRTVKSLPVQHQRRDWLAAVKAFFSMEINTRFDRRRMPQVARKFRPLHFTTAATRHSIQRRKDREYWERSANHWAEKSHEKGLRPETVEMYSRWSEGCWKKAGAA